MALELRLSLTLRRRGEEEEDYSRIFKNKQNLCKNTPGPNPVPSSSLYI
jgi:hypothetical protein